MNRFSTLILAAAASTVLLSTSAFAQAEPAGRTRAEVVAEMHAAAARGELQAGHQWGVDVPPVLTRAQQVRVAAAKTQASQAKALSQN